MTKIRRETERRWRVCVRAVTAERGDVRERDGRRGMKKNEKARKSERPDEGETLARPGWTGTSRPRASNKRVRRTERERKREREDTQPRAAYAHAHASVNSRGIWPALLLKLSFLRAPGAFVRSFVRYSRACVRVPDTMPRSLPLSPIRPALAFSHSCARARARARAPRKLQAV